MRTITTIFLALLLSITLFSCSESPTSPTTTNDWVQVYQSNGIDSMYCPYPSNWEGSADFIHQLSEPINYNDSIKIITSTIGGKNVKFDFGTYTQISIISNYGECIRKARMLDNTKDHFDISALVQGQTSFIVLYSKVYKKSNNK